MVSMSDSARSMLRLSCLSVRKKDLPWCGGDAGERLDSEEEPPSLSEPGWLCTEFASGFCLTCVCSVHASVCVCVCVGGGGGGLRITMDILTHLLIQCSHDQSHDVPLSSLTILGVLATDRAESPLSSTMVMSAPLANR